MSEMSGEGWPGLAWPLAPKKDKLYIVIVVFGCSWESMDQNCFGNIIFTGIYL